jgi:hypothetical protein
VPPVAVAAAQNGIPSRVTFEFASSEYNLRTYSKRAAQRAAPERDGVRTPVII